MQYNLVYFFLFWDQSWYLKHMIFLSKYYRIPIENWFWTLIQLILSHPLPSYDHSSSLLHDRSNTGPALTPPRIVQKGRAEAGAEQLLLVLLDGHVDLLWTRDVAGRRSLSGRRMTWVWGDALTEWDAEDGVRRRSGRRRVAFGMAVWKRVKKI